MYNNKGRVLYFAFGSNLFKERININCPSAKFQCAAKLEDYKLDYFNYSEMWHGAGASIVSSAGAHCYGAVWSISTDEVAALDRQELCGHPKGYTRITVEVCPVGDVTNITCITYEVTDKSQPGLPSLPYKEMIIKGATQCGLPRDYITVLETVTDNGYHGEVNLTDNK